MDNPSSLTFFLFCFCWVALIAGAVLGYIIGIRMARNKERHRLVKEKIRKNKVAIYHYQKEKYEYIEQINRLEEDLHNLTEESELYKERVADLEYYQRKVRESEQIIERLSSETAETADVVPNAFSLLMQLKKDPVRTNPTRQEWTELKEKSGITRHEEEICCLIKWNFPRKDQLAVFNNTTDALTKSKSRLKKRLQLDEKTDLDQYIRFY